jgi:hypothetical protein
LYCSLRGRNQWPRSTGASNYNGRPSQPQYCLNFTVCWYYFEAQSHCPLQVVILPSLWCRRLPPPLQPLNINCEKRECAAAESCDVNKRDTCARLASLIQCRAKATDEGAGFLCSDRHNSAVLCCPGRIPGHYADTDGQRSAGGCAE